MASFLKSSLEREWWCLWGPAFSFFALEKFFFTLILSLSLYLLLPFLHKETNFSLYIIPEVVFPKQVWV